MFSDQHLFKDMLTINEKNQGETLYKEEQFCSFYLQTDGLFHWFVYYEMEIPRWRLNSRSLSFLFISIHGTIAPELNAVNFDRVSDLKI